MNRSALSRFISNLIHEPRQKISLTTWTALIGFVLAQGAPAGFFLHDYLFNPSSLGFREHSLRLMDTQKSTLLYIWLGTSFFFAFFGAAIGYLNDRIHRFSHYLSEARFHSNFTDDMKQDFMVKLVHQLRTPVTIALEFLRTLQAGYLGVINEKQNQLSLGTIDELVKLDQSLRKMLDFIRLKKFSMNESEDASLDQLIEKILLKYQVMHQEREFDFQKTTREESITKVHSELIELSLVHLLNNAVQYTSNEKITIRLSNKTGKEIIRVNPRHPDLSHISPRENYYCITVEDKGPGIPDQMLTQVFEPFVSLTVNDDENANMGLGLSMVRDVAEWHGGLAWVHSKPGMGTTITLALPATTPTRPLRNVA